LKSDSKLATKSFVTRGRILRANGTSTATAIQEAADVEAKLAAAYLVLKMRQDYALEANLDRTTELAVALAERLVGAALEIAPEKIARMAQAALSEAKGARKALIEANPIDVEALREHTASLGESITIEPNADLARGALVLHTDLGTLDARLTPQLERLARALRDALR
jgi:flagellar biosynthesis/type III secretory pathway protein FliH